MRAGRLKSNEAAANEEERKRLERLAQVPDSDSDDEIMFGNRLVVSSSQCSYLEHNPSSALFAVSLLQVSSRSSIGCLLWLGATIAAHGRPHS